MFGSAILDVAIGIIFIYLLLSLLVTTASELIASVTKWRAQTLQEGIRNLLKVDANKTGLADLLYGHPLVKGLSRPGEIPSYIPPHTFVLALLDTITPATARAARTAADIVNGIDSIKDPDVKRALTALWTDAGQNVKKLEEKIETWFNDTMDRVSGWYKRKAQLVTVIVSVFIVALLNADTIQIGTTLSTDATVRAALVTQAQEFAKKDVNPSGSLPPAGIEKPAAAADTKAAAEKFGATLTSIQQLGIPIGWTLRAKDNPGCQPKTQSTAGPSGPADLRCVPEGWGWLYKFFGLALTAVAASLGAPFWFDVLNKVINIRSAGRAPDEKK